MKRYMKLWWFLTVRGTQIAFTSRTSAVLFLFGKILRYISFLFFITVLISRTKTIAGYTFWQMIFFFLSFNMIDTSAQLFMREVYRFRSQIVSGYFDHILAKPIATLYTILLGGSDVLDI